MKKRYYPYGINIKYELKTYKRVGKDYHYAVNTTTSTNFKLFSWIRKKKVSEDKKSYAVCDKYTEWENYINVKINNKLKTRRNKMNFYHWCKMNKEKDEISMTRLEILSIPIYLLIASLFDDCIFLTAFFLFFSFAVCAIRCKDIKRKIAFWGDIMSIIISDSDF